MGLATCSQRCAETPDLPLDIALYPHLHILHILHQESIHPPGGLAWDAAGVIHNRMTQPSVSTYSLQKNCLSSGFCWRITCVMEPTAPDKLPTHPGLARMGISRADIRDKTLLYLVSCMDASSCRIVETYRKKSSHLPAIIRQGASEAIVLLNHGLFCFTKNRKQVIRYRGVKAYNLGSTSYKLGNELTQTTYFALFKVQLLISYWSNGVREFCITV